jgi:hypothetical protein
LEDAAQLVIGAPGSGQVSITNPNPVRRVARPRTVAKKVVKKNPFAIPATAQLAPPNTNAPINQTFKDIGKSVTDFGKTYVDTLAQQRAELLRAATHPGIHRITDPEGHIDPEHLQTMILESVKGAKIAGIP